MQSDPLTVLPAPSSIRSWKKNPRSGLFLCRQVGDLLVSDVVLGLFQLSLPSSAKSLARARRGLPGEQQQLRGEVAPAVVCRESGWTIAVASCALNL